MTSDKEASDSEYAPLRGNLQKELGGARKRLVRKKGTDRKVYCPEPSKLEGRSAEVPSPESSGGGGGGGVGVGWVGDQGLGLWGLGGGF